MNPANMDKAHELACNIRALDRAIENVKKNATLKVVVRDGTRADEWVTPGHGADEIIRYTVLYDLSTRKAKLEQEARGL